MLAGRAFRYSCHPLTHIEIADEFNLNDVLKFGALPEIFSLSLEDKKDYLRSYVEIYFKEEIVAEQIVRKLRPFKNFLSVAAQMNGKILNLNKIANNVGVDHTTVQNYFEILEETLVGFLLEPFHESIRKRQRQASKFYFFDIGVKRALDLSIRAPVVSGTSFYGETFEHFIILEFYKLNTYLETDFKISYFETSDHSEIDLILSRGREKIFIEIKSTQRIDLTEVNKLSNYAKEEKAKAYYLSNDSISQVINNVRCLPWETGIKEIFEIK